MQVVTYLHTRFHGSVSDDRARAHRVGPETELTLTDCSLRGASCFFMGVAALFRAGPSPIFDSCVALDFSAVSPASCPFGSPSVWRSRPSSTRASCTGGWRSTSRRRAQACTADLPRSHTLELVRPMRWRVTLITTRAPTANRSNAPASAIAVRVRLQSDSLLLGRSSPRFRSRARERFSPTRRPRGFRRTSSFLSRTARPALPLARS
jgi:hypothetical protein